MVTVTGSDVPAFAHLDAACMLRLMLTDPLAFIQSIEAVLGKGVIQRQRQHHRGVRKPAVGFALDLPLRRRIHQRHVGDVRRRRARRGRGATSAVIGSLARFGFTIYVWYKPALAPREGWCYHHAQAILINTPKRRWATENPFLIKQHGRRRSLLEQGNLRRSIQLGRRKTGNRNAEQPDGLLRREDGLQ
jgi:hypothetical protein